MKRELQKINCITIFAVVLTAVICMFIDFLWGNIAFLVTCVFLSLLILKIMSKKYRQCLNKEVDLFYKDFDIERVSRVHEEVLNGKWIFYKSVVLQQYLLLLFVSCQFDKFVEVYQKYRKVAKSVNSWRSLDFILLNLSSISNKREEYRERIFAYKLSKYYNSKRKLNEIQKYRRNKDLAIIVRRFYEIGNYEKVIEKIENESLENNLFFRSLKERSLYHLGKEYHYPELKDTNLLFTKQWEVLVKTGQEYYDDALNNIISIIKRDRKVSRRKYMIFYVFDSILIFILMTWIIVLEPPMDTKIEPLSEEAREIRQLQLNEKFPEKHLEIQTEIKMDDVIVSGATNDEWMYLYMFESTGDFEYMNYSIGVGQKNSISFCYRDKLGEVYNIYWILNPEIETSKITYSIKRKDDETISFDTDEIFYWKIPFADCKYAISHLDTYGNIVYESSDLDYINKRVLLDKTMYANSGITCEPVPDNEISGIVNSTTLFNYIPTKDNQSNFGIGLPYKLEEDCLKVKVYEQWYIFDKLWSVDVSASEIREDGMKIVCTHSGSGIATNFHMNDQYWIHKKTEDGWEEVSPITDDELMGEGYSIPENRSIEIEVNWKESYKLASGKYRVVKNLYWFDNIQNKFVSSDCYFEFEIQ